MWDVIQRGGPLMYIILFCSILALAVALERLYALRRAKIDTKDFMSRVSATLKRNKIMESIEMCNNKPGPIAQIMKGVADCIPTAAAAYTLPTAANLVAGIANCQVGDSFSWFVNNASAGANTITVGAGAGCTVDGTLTVAQHVVRQFLFVVTNVTGASEAYTCYGIGA